MSRMGVHFAVPGPVYRSLKSKRTDEERLAYVDDVIDKGYAEFLGTETDKAWSLTHSALQQSNPCSDYLERTTRGPASWAILGKDDLALTDEAFVGHVGKWNAIRVLHHLRAIASNDIRDRLQALIKTHHCNQLSDEDADYAAAWFPKLVDFYERAVRARRHVIFLGDLC